MNFCHYAPDLLVETCMATPYSGASSLCRSPDVGLSKDVSPDESVIFIAAEIDRGVRGKGRQVLQSERNQVMDSL